MYINDKLLIAKNSEKELYISSDMINRHGIITGATGTGKTVSVKVLAESFSQSGIPVFMADIKGDLSGTCEKGIENENIKKRIEKLNLKTFKYQKYPVRFWDIYGLNGHFIKAKVENIEPALLSRILGLSESQEGNLNIAFKVAQDENMPIIDFKDLKAVLKYICDNRNDYISTYGNITTQSIGAIQRRLLEFENTGGEIFFGEPELDIKSLIKYDTGTGEGYINILNAEKLVKDYNLYSTFMLWMLNELYDKLPEVGDLAKPKLVFFIDEAHLLFDEMSSSMLKKVVQIVKLIRSKGVGLYFISQSPSDIPEDILSQLGNRIQHNLRAYTPLEQKNVKAAAQSFRTNPNFNTEKAIQELETGEAVISFINEYGQPDIAQRAYILPPQSKMGVANINIVNEIINNSDLKDFYSSSIDCESAYEIIEKINQEKEELQKKELDKKDNISKTKSTNKKSRSSKVVDRTLSSAASTIGRKIGNQIFKGLFK